MTTSRFALTLVIAGRDQLWTQSSPGIKGVVGAFHRFGASLAAGATSTATGAGTSWPAHRTTASSVTPRPAR